MSLKKIASEILSAKNVGITYHASPDGDAVGSVLALINGLKSLNKNCYVISREKPSENLRFLPGSEEITGEITAPLKNSDLVIVLDCGSLDRVCGNVEEFSGLLINVDHHITNDKYGDINYVDARAAATAEIVYELLQILKIDFNKANDTTLKIGTCIYTALVTDTGGFRHSNVTEKTHRIAAVLKKIGVNNTFIYQSLFDNKEFDRIKLIGKALSSIELVLDGKVALLEMTNSFGRDIGIDEIGDTSDIISYGLQIKGVEVTLLLKEADDCVKASLRSKDKVDVRKVAEIFGGGGHIKAAGIKIRNISLEEAKFEILKEIKKEL